MRPRRPGETNHPPGAGFRGEASRAIVRLPARPGEEVRLDASGSADPDDDRLAYRWSIYEEAGSYRGPAPIANPDAAVATLRVPKDASGHTLHVILEVIDDGEPSLRGYRRIILQVSPDPKTD